MINCCANGDFKIAKVINLALQAWILFCDDQRTESEQKTL